MGTLSRSRTRRPRRIALGGAALAAIGLAVAPTASAAADAAPAALGKAPQGLYLFQYTHNDHLKIGGGNFTLGGKVYIVVKYNTGKVRYEGNVIAKTNTGVPGGAAYLETNISAPCAPGNNGFAQAYNYSTSTWSPTLPVAICVRLD
ncbi:hypothetical protein [Streptomyces sp. NBC_01565]|uniref:hypothetical protein n=1 Tax=unclassified Streptomyces TaxID=2593676 RepID=UPI002259B329|nr:hypothetical protein [Streptomyces sp. NBC_01565]MCX4539066.1 hypothetical protein [Streptomyces sp. NBC_01565]